MRTTLHGRIALVLVMAGLFAAGPVLAEKPDWAGNGKPGKSAQEFRREDPRDKGRDDARYRDDGRREARRDDSRSSRSNVQLNMYFNDQHRTAVRGYYTESYRSGRCPPGLAKKGNGCMPPGQAKKWKLGRPLPREVVYYDLPPRVIVDLGPPPAGHKFVRVASDILLIAIGTGMVVDAINDLGGM